ncbi:MAG: RdgB/HAM1 family non-canonical purine NTP pyrophosphatase [Candidatus Nomurabacteria bacterium]|jgi:XTP/dITP diphosphohydrolase|nr:RdgB/HAM1 family non-canonical purine NTP pyrophosphatase [Candidatus Nomurabacteria bacterium]
MKGLTLITGSAGKAKEYVVLLGFEIETEKIDLPEIQSTNVVEVVREKAKVAYEKLQRPVIVDDTGLTIKAWKNLPGALIKWFLQNVGDHGIVEMLGDKQRDALVTTAIGYCDENGVRIFTGEVAGKISDKPRGKNGFGYDTIFIPGDSDLTYAEMTDDEKNKTSMRAMAVAKLKAFLQN